MSSEWPKDFFRLHLKARTVEPGSIRSQPWFDDLLTSLNRCLPLNGVFREERSDDDEIWYCAGIEEKCLIHLRVGFNDRNRDQLGIMIRFEHSLTFLQELWELAVRLFSNRMERENTMLRERYQPVFEAMERTLRQSPVFRE